MWAGIRYASLLKTAYSLHAVRWELVCCFAVLGGTLELLALVPKWYPHLGPAASTAAYASIYAST